MTDRLDRIEELLLAITENLNKVKTNSSQPITALVKKSTVLEKTNATLDKTNATLDKTNATLDRVATQQERNTANIDKLKMLMFARKAEAQALHKLIATNEQQFNTLIQEMRSDRRALQQSFQAFLLSLANVNGLGIAPEQAD